MAKERVDWPSASRRQALAHAFKCALKHIKERKFICNALEAAHTHSEITGPIKGEAQRLIMKRLGYANNLGMWINRNYPELNIYVCSHKEYSDRMLATRKAWLKSLIKEFGG